jgi:hypothetical protein
MVRWKSLALTGNTTARVVVLRPKLRIRRGASRARHGNRRDGRDSIAGHERGTRADGLVEIIAIARRSGPVVGNLHELLLRLKRHARRDGLGLERAGLLHAIVGVDARVRDRVVRIHGS